MVCEAIRSRTFFTRIPETAKAMPSRKRICASAEWFVRQSYTHHTRADRASPHHGGRRVLRMVLLWISGLGIGFWLRGVQP